MPLVKTIGIVIFRRRPNGCEYLLLHHRGPYWNFPKGRMEPEEAGRELVTAFRELYEETSIPHHAVRLLPRFRATYRYRFVGRDLQGRQELVTKLAVFYLGELVKGVAVAVSHEHQAIAWVDATTARERLYYPNGQKILAAATAYIRRLEHRFASGTPAPRPKNPTLIMPRGSALGGKSSVPNKSQIQKRQPR